MKNAMSFLVLILFLATACSSAPTPTVLRESRSTPPIPSATLPVPTLAPAPATATITQIPPTLPPLQPTATLARAQPTASTLPKDARGFSIFETEHATILSQPGVSDDNSRQVGNYFGIAYRVVGEDLAYADKRPRLYVYRSEDDLFQDLVTTWHYDEWYKTNRAIPRMDRDYTEWIPGQRSEDIVYITHEYSHRIIEQIAGISAQINFKWFDEGLAEYEGMRALAVQSPVTVAMQRDERINPVVSAFQNGALLRLKDITSEEQRRQLSGSKRDLAYLESYVAMDYLVRQHGIAQVKNVLNLVGKGQSFSDAFQKVYAITVDEFEKEFLTFVPKVKDEVESATCFKIDGQLDDWQKLKPLIIDDPYPAIARAADVRQVYAAICKGALYVAIVVDGPASVGPTVSYCFDVDTNGDGTPEYQPAFDRTRTWLWNLKGTGYTDQKNLSFPADTKAVVNQVAESMFPLILLDNATAPRIRVYTTIGNQMTKRRTGWAAVQLLEAR